MVTDAVSCPLTQRQLIDEYFMEHRTKVLDLAAFLDRLDRRFDRLSEARRIGLLRPSWMPFTSSRQSRCASRWTAHIAPCPS